MEPTCLGAGGMVFVDPLFQACMVEVVRSSADLFSGGQTPQPNVTNSPTGKLVRGVNQGDWQGLPVIYDEGMTSCIPLFYLSDPLSVFSGLNRFGYNSAASVLGHTPDIAIYAKILTGGLLPLSATLASHSIFSSFLSEHKVDALLHGHSYTANPIGCSVALKSMEMVQDMEWKEEKALWNCSSRWSFWSEEFVQATSRVQGVSASMAMGTVFALELEDGQGGEPTQITLRIRDGSS